MIEIDPRQVTPALISMFDLNMPTGIRALAVLAGGNAGRIFVDNPGYPLWGLVWEADDGTLYRGGKYNKDILCEAVALLRKGGVVAIVFREGDPSADFPPDPDAGADCVEFNRPIGGSDLSPYLREMPSGYSIHRMNRALLEKSPMHEEKINRYGNTENLFTRGIVVCILHGDKMICEAYADMDILGMREIGINTHEAYRRQGFATIACSYLIKLCEETGSQTYWDCAKLNSASSKLAYKLGFQNERIYKRLAWFKVKE